MSSNPIHGKVYLIQHYVIRFASDLRQVGGVLRVLRVSTTTIYLNFVESGVLKANQTSIYTDYHLFLYCLLDNLFVY